MQQTEIEPEDIGTFQRVTPKAESFSITLFKDEVVEIHVNGKIVKTLKAAVNGNLGCYFNKASVPQGNRRF